MKELDKTTFIEKAKDNPKDRIDVIIGDDKQPDFKPQIKIERWDNESNVSIRLKDNEFNGLTPTSREGKLKLEGATKEAHFYPVENGYEFEVLLKEKPKSNVIEFTLGDKDVEYFYQPELTKEEIDKGAKRPENVVGSYAVYAKSNKVNWIDGKEYKVGKIGHIYRPRIIDSMGKEVWGELHIENGILSVTIPQKFLDEAVYPVAVDPTFGYATEGGTTIIFDPEGCVFELFNVSETGTIDSISFYTSVSTGSGTEDFKGGIADSSLNILTNGVTGKISEPLTTSGEWVVATYSTKPTVSSGNYNLAFFHDLNQETEIYCDSIGTEEIYGDDTNTIDSIGSALVKDRNPFVSNAQCSIYCTYTAGGDDVDISATINSSTFSVISPTISAEQGVNVIAGINSSTFSVLNPTVTAQGEGFSNGYTYRRSITVDADKVSGSANLENFPFLFKGTYDYLADTGNGGKVEDSDGYDIIFTSDEAGETQLDHEIEKYDNTTGECIIWVEIPSLDHDDNTTIYLFYGKSGASDTQDAAGVWSHKYHAALHLKEEGNNNANGYVDSSGNSHHGTGTNMDAADQVAAKIGYGSNFDASEYITITGFDLGSTWTIYGWIKHDTGTADQALFGNANLQIWRDEYASGDRYGIAINDNGWKVQYGSTQPDTSSGYFVGMVYNSGSSQLYVNGSAEGSALSASFTRSGDYLIARGDATSNKPHDGWIDELRIANINLSGDWLITEYNNHNNPSTFYSLGGEETNVTNVSIPATINNATFSAPSVIATGEIIATPSVAEATFINLDVVVSAQKQVSISASINESTFTILDVAVGAGVGISASISEATFSIPSVTISTIQKVDIPASVNSATFIAPSVVITGDVLVSAGLNSATFTALNVSVSAIKNVSISAGINEATFTINDVVISGKSVIEASINEATFLALNPTISTEIKIDVLASINEGTFTAVSPTAEGKINVSISAEVNSITFSVPATIIKYGVAVLGTINSATFSINDVVVLGEGVMVVSAGIVEGSFSIPEVLVIGFASFLTSENTATFTAPNTTITGDVVIQGSINSATFTALGVVIEGSSLSQAGINEATFEVPSVVITGDVVVSAGINEGLFSVNGAIVNTGIKFEVSINEATFSVLSPTILEGVGIPTLVNSAIFSIPSVVVEYAVKFEVDVNSGTFSVISPEILGESITQVGLNTATFSVLGVSVAIGISFEIGASQATFSIPEIGIVGDVLVAVGVNSSTFNVLDVIVSGEAEIPVSINSGIFTIPEAQVNYETSFIGSINSATFNVGNVVITGDVITQASVNSAVFSVLDVSAKTGTTFGVNINSAVFTIPDVLISAGVLTEIGINTAIFNVPSPIIAQSISFVVGLNTAIFLTPSVIVSIGKTILVDVNNATFTIISPVLKNYFYKPKRVNQGYLRTTPKTKIGQSDYLRTLDNIGEIRRKL